MTDAALRVAEAASPPGTLPCYQLPDWRERYGLVAGVTDARGDFRLGPQGARGRLGERWETLLRGLGPGFSEVVVSRQVHGATVLRHRQPPESGLTVTGEADGHLTDRPGRLLVVTVADCVPVYLALPDAGALALLHAGWRGVAAGILQAGVSALCEAAACSTCDVVMHCGVAICGRCYEVGPEVVRAVTGETVPRHRGLDLRAELVRRGRGLGLGRVTASPWCVAHDRGRFHSHRGSGGAPHRMAAYLGRPVP